MLIWKCCLQSVGRLKKKSIVTEKVMVTISLSVAVRNGMFWQALTDLTTSSEALMGTQLAHISIEWQVRNSWYLNTPRAMSFLEILLAINDGIWIIKFIGNYDSHRNRPISQIPECTCSISHNASIQNRNVHLYVMNGALWDMELMHSGICELGHLEGIISNWYSAGS